MDQPTAPTTSPEQVSKPEDHAEHRHINLKWLMLVFTIFFIILVVFLLILHFEKQKEGAVVDYSDKDAATPKPNQIVPESQGIGAGEVETPTTPEMLQQSSPELSQEEIEQIKMDIITGKEDDVPAGLDMTSRAIIREYLSNCYFKEDLSQKLECYELYFLNNDASLKKQKNDCEAFSGDEKTICLDNYYFQMGTWQRAIFCEAITNPDLRTECVNTAV